MKTNSDYGCDPLGNGNFRMIPSGDIVDAEEKNRRLSPSHRRGLKTDCLGLSWQQIAMMQGGLQTLDITRNTKVNNNNNNNK